MNCDWCGEDFTEGEETFAGYQDEPTHRKCLSQALRAWNLDRGYDDTAWEREPFTDWPNGQGTYD